MQFNGFKKETTQFLIDLKNNNSKEWFEDNRHIWEKYVKDINVDFVQDMGETLQMLVPTINIKPKVSGSLFKIYRDVRFSKDKTPMKDKVGFIFWQGQAHRMQSSCFYLQYNIEEYLSAVGIRVFKAPLLKTYREYIKVEKHRVELHNIIENLKEQGYILSLPKYKRIPNIYNADDKYIYLSLYAGIFMYKTYKVDDIFYKVEILDKVFGDYENMKDLQKWVYEMTLS